MLPWASSIHRWSELLWVAVWGVDLMVAENKEEKGIKICLDVNGS